MIALATDFDGTIFFMNENPSFHDKDLEAIKEFQKENKIGLCSGRPYTSVTYFTDTHFQFDFIIASTGSFIMDGKGNVIYDKPLNLEIVQTIAKEFVDTHIVFFHCNQRFTTYQLELEEGNFNHLNLMNLNELKDYTIYQISIVGKSQEEAKKIEKYLNDHFDVNAFQNNNMIDIVHSNCSKGKGIEICKEYFKFDKIAGIGDSQNDISMFQSCDTSFTFSNSDAEVQNQVDVVVNHFYEAVNQLMAKEE